MKKLLTLLLIFPVIAFAQIPDPQPGTYVNDSYGFLHSTDVQQLNKNIRTLEDSFGIQLAIVLVPAIPPKYSIDEYANQIGRKWHVGNAKNGIVYVAAIDEHLQRLEVASHIEGVIPDIIAKGLLKNVGVYYRAQKYGEGLLNLVRDLQVRLESNKAELRKLMADEQKKKNSSDTGTIVFIILLLGGAVVGIGGYALYRWLKLRRIERETKDLEARIKSEPEVYASGFNLFEKEQAVPRHNRRSQYGNYTQPEINILPVMPIMPPDFNDDNICPDCNSGNSSASSGSSDYSSGSSDSGSSSSSDYGNWGSSSSDSGSSYDSGGSSSGFDGGGSSDSW